MIKWNFDKDKKKTRNLQDIETNEVSLVDSPANGIPFLIVKNEAGTQLNSLEEIISCEEFDSAAVEEVDVIMKQLDFIDDDTADAISNLCLAVASNPALAKSCAEGHWPSITGIKEIVELPCLVEKSELNEVESFFQKFVSTSEFELAIIDNALETIGDLDDTSLSAVYSLMKLDWKEADVEKWPSISRREEISVEKNTDDDDNDSEDEPLTKRSLWPSISNREGRPEPAKEAKPKLWPSLSG